jgi:hypothetical protein
MLWVFGKRSKNLLSTVLLLLALFVSSLALANDRVVFTVVERVQFSVPGDWPVISSKSTAEKTVFAFQIPNAGDEGTDDSTNLSIISSYLQNAKDKDAFEKKASSLDPSAKEKKLVDGWSCSSFSGMQKSTNYVVWDCHRVVADCGVSVRIAWPHLHRNLADYDKQMETVLSDFLTSVVPSQKRSK